MLVFFGEELLANVRNTEREARRRSAAAKLGGTDRTADGGEQRDNMYREAIILQCVRFVNPIMFSYTISVLFVLYRAFALSGSIPL